MNIFFRPEKAPALPPVTNSVLLSDVKYCCLISGKAIFTIYTSITESNGATSTISNAIYLLVSFIFTKKRWVKFVLNYTQRIKKKLEFQHRGKYNSPGSYQIQISYGSTAVIRIPPFGS